MNMGREGVVGLVFSCFFVAAASSQALSKPQRERSVRVDMDCTVRIERDTFRVYSGHKFLGRSG